MRFHTHTHTRFKNRFNVVEQFSVHRKTSGSAETAPLLEPALPGARGGNGAQGCGSLSASLRGGWTPLCLPTPLLDRELFPSAQAPVQS